MLNKGHELILGSLRSGKSRAAEARAAAWLGGDLGHKVGRDAVLIVTTQPGEGELAMRLERQRAERSLRLPELRTVDAARHLGTTILGLADERRLLLIDNLAIWLRQCLMPPGATTLTQATASEWLAEHDALLDALSRSASPIVLVSDEIGAPVQPLPRDAQACADALGLLNQAVAEHCRRVTLMMAGCELPVKRLT